MHSPFIVADEFPFNTLAMPALIALALDLVLDPALDDVTRAVRHFHSWLTHLVATSSFFRSPSRPCVLNSLRQGNLDELDLRGLTG